jgi:DNA invertase Pin-like site-specific DNA recombinase
MTRRVPRSDAPPSKRAAIYTRKSTSAGLEQEFNSLDAQRERCENYAKSQGWQVVGTYDDGGFTGANIERPAFQRLLADIDASKVDVVVVYKVDRLSRSLLDFARVMERFGSHEVAFVSVTQNFSTADAMGRLTLNMLMSFAEFEREMIAERTRDKIVSARRKGKWTGGTVPVGYTVVDRKLVKNASEAHVIKEVFDLYEKHQSVLAVVRDLRARGRKRRNGEWTKDGVLRVLKNPIYAGLMAAAGELHTAEHDAIISREQLERVRQMLDGPRARPRPGKNPHYLLKGLIHCGVCGAAMTPAGSRTYRYYRCVTRDKLGASACTTKPLAAEAIERFVVGRLRDLAGNERRAAELVAGVRGRLKADRQALVAQRSALSGKVAKVSAEARRLLGSLSRLSGRALQGAEQRFEGASAAQQQAEQSLAALEAKLSATDEADADAVWVQSALGNFDTLWELMTPDNRQRLVAALLDRIDVNDAANTFDMKLSLLAEAA